MDILTLNTQSVSAYANAHLCCSCACDHVITTRSVMAGFNVIKQIDKLVSSIAPPYSACLVLTDSVVASVTIRRVEKQLSASGYRVRTHTFGSPPQNDVAEVQQVEIQEDTMFIVGVGGETMANLTKILASIRKLPSAFGASTPSCLSLLTPYARLYDGEIKRVISVDSFKSVMIENDFLSSSTDFVCGAFGSLCASLISLLDYKISSILNRDEFCCSTYEYGVGIVSEVIAKLEDKAIAPSDVSGFIAQMSLRYSSIGQFQQNSIACFGSHTYVSHALELLFANEEREILSRGEVEFMVSRIIGQLYKSVFKLPSNLMAFPPDSHLRMSALSEYFGLSEYESASLVKNSSSRLSINSLQNYRLKEYSTELMIECVKINKLLDRAWKIFKRMHDDDGYSLINYFTPNEIAISLSLADELSDNFTFISYLKNVGLLEEYLKDM